MAASFAVIQLGLIMAVLLLTDHRDVTVVIIMGQGIAGAFFIAAIVEYIMITKRQKTHRDYLARLPPGEIPIEKRSLVSKRKYIPKEDSSIEHKYPTPKDFNLRGDWNEIALSKDEWRQRCREEGNMFLIFSILCFIGALVLVIIPLYFFENIICGEGCLLLFIGVVTAIGSLSERRKGIKDLPRHVRINLKTVGIKRVQELMSAFLDEHSIEYSCKTIKPDRKYNYILPEGIVIKVFYKGNRSAYAQQGAKRLEIHYDSTNYEKAREIQIGMDKFFTRKDIIYQKI